MNQENFNQKNFKPSAKAKRVAFIIAGTLVGISVASVITTVCMYDSFFVRYERPNYDLTPGLYCYERIQDDLKREEIKIPSGDNKLQGYYYPAENARGLAVLAHGFHAGADDYLPLIEAIVNRGYSVLTYDVTGTYSSGGDDGIGMCQPLVDIDNVLNFANREEPFKNMPKVVIGHSLGGYAASSVLALHPEIKAAALIAPMNNAATIMLEKAEQYVGEVANTAKPIFDAYQEILFGNYVNYNGVIGINSTDAPVLIAQGVDDTDITPEGQSITAFMSQITNPNVQVYWKGGLQGTHTGIWHSVEAEAYKRSIENRIKEMEKELDRKLTDSELACIYDSIDHRLYSDVNIELVDLMIQTFDKGIAK